MAHAHSDLSPMSAPQDVYLVTQPLHANYANTDSIYKMEYVSPTMATVSKIVRLISQGMPANYVILAT